MGINTTVNALNNLKDVHYQWNTSSGGGGGNGGNSPNLNRVQQQINKGQAPKNVERLDKPNYGPDGKALHNGQPEIHFKDGSSLNLDGTWKHPPKGKSPLTNEVMKWLNEIGWGLPK